MSALNVNPLDVATSTVAVDEPREWLETAVRSWEAEIEAAGWDRPARLAVVVLVPRPMGLGVAEIPFPEEVMERPDLLLQMMAEDDPDRIRRGVMPQQWRDSGWMPMALVLSVEAWTLPADADFSLFGEDGTIAGHPQRVEERQVLLVGPQPEHSFTLVRTRGVLGPEIRRGVAAEWQGMDGAPTTELEDSMRRVARMVVPVGLGGDAPNP